MQKWIVGIALISLAGCSQLQSQQAGAPELPQGVTFIEQIKAGQFSDTPVIPYSKYQLANGLTVVLHEDNSDPLVHVDMTYHVGSAREELGKSGFAHFFEHMMFQGSEHVGDQEHFKLITEAGGTLNGTTNRDRTNYFQTVPANQLEKVLWLEADRMGFLLGAVSQRKFEIQRSTVKNERAQRYENRPYGLVYERMGEALYPRTHPYSWQTIGYVEDLDRVDVNDLKAFFLRWYGPNNATLTIGGDIDVEQTLEWVNKYYGSIPRGPEVEKPAKQPVTVENDLYLTLEDKIQQPMLLMAWPTSYNGADDEASLDMLARVIGGGKNSLMYQNLVKTGKVVDAGAFHDCAELACTMYVYAIGQSGKQGDLKKLRAEVTDILDGLEERGVSTKELEELKGMVEANAIFGLQSVSGKVSQLAAYETFFDDPGYLGTELSNLRSVTTASMEQAYMRYLNGHPNVTLSVVPRGRTSIEAAKPNFTPPPRIIPEYTKVSEEKLQQQMRVPVDDFDRSVMPQPSSPVEAVMPELYQFELANGIKVLGTEYRETPTVEIQMVVPAGRRFEPEGKAGLAKLTASMMAEASEASTVEELSSRLDRLGSTVSFSAGKYGTVVSVTSLTKFLPETLEIMQERLFHPAFNQADFDRVKQQALEGIIYEHQRPAWLAGQATREVLFGGTTFSLPPEGTKGSLESITLEDVKAFQRRYYTPNGADIVVVGDIDKAKLNTSLGFLADWQGMPEPSYVTPALPSLPKQTVWLVDKPGAPQTVIRLARQGLPYDATGELYETQLANFNLAGNFNSRINLNLREDKGYTYGAGGYQSGGKEVGLSVYYAQVRADATLPSVKEFLAELDKMSSEGVTEEELNFMRLAVGQKDALNYETPSKKAQLLGQILTYSLPENFVETRNEIVASISKARIDELAAKWFNPSDYQIIVVGDAASLKPQLETLGLPVKALSPTM
ncbi:insulinase family protein [Photobacterium gaetbulicola]|uniref:Insulinase family protease n=1 Tax=Photobacterium gaetbulicola Gung47 TaxID=658445 RepID=A0A0C5W7Q2_9GAMM|nr:pitrilysin family protein [Photobacterium gaetbulicola]AJR07571.1 insulinase family protease [Photobacterium gaetbulicola Gung47]PSU04468.1 insulinase family protein [Photobacterium gaetbulicola]